MGAKVLALLLESAATGGLYVTVALGLSLVAGVMRLLNLAQGEFLVGSVYIVLMLMKALHIDPFLSMLGTLPIVFAGAYLIQRHLLQKLMTHSGEAPLVATFGLSIAAQATFQILYGSNPVAVSSDLGLIGVSIFGHTVRWISILAVALGIALTVGTHFLLVGTTFGRSLRAAAEDPLAAQSLGVDVRHVFAMCFGLGAVLTACGAVVGRHRLQRRTDQRPPLADPWRHRRRDRRHGVDLGNFVRRRVGRTGRGGRRRLAWPGIPRPRDFHASGRAVGRSSERIIQ
jgi:branched-chain amino acid transport system permease protein